MEHQYQLTLSNGLRTERLHGVLGLYRVVISWIMESWLHQHIFRCRLDFYQLCKCVESTRGFKKLFSLNVFYNMHPTFRQFFAKHSVNGSGSYQCL